MTTPVERNPLGTHVPLGKGLVDGALASATSLGCEAFQIFVGNPRGWTASAGRPEDDHAFRSRIETLGLRVFIHAPYLINLGSATPATYEKSAALVAHNLRRAAEIGAEGVVIHTGSYKTTAPDEPAGAEDPREAALRRTREALLPLLDTLRGDDAPWLLLEPSAGQGSSLCTGVEGLTAYLGALDHHPRAGLCLDTCHVFAAGAPLDEPGGTSATVDRIVEIGGAGRLRLIHANDSMDVRGAFKDRHQHIGEGHIGTGAFTELFAHPATAGVPFILETPGSRQGDSPDLPLLRSLRKPS